MSTQACYRNLKNYKYQLMKDYQMKIDIKPEHTIDLIFIVLTAEGELKIKDRYAWDGPSGPTIDTPSFIRGSLVHDALYQLMRERRIDHEIHREYADDLLKQICLEDGMSKFRAWYVHKAVRIFGIHSASPKPNPAAEIICVP